MQANPYKRPAPDNKGIPMYQPSAAAYQQLMQLQSQQPYIPVSCEYSSSQSHASADTIYQNPNTSTATLNANNLHHHLNLYQTSINACNMSSNNKNYNENFENNASNFNKTSTFFAETADAPTAQQNSISQSSPSKVAPSNNIEHTLSKNAVVTSAVAAATSPDDGDSENALIVQNAKIISASGSDDSVVASSTVGVHESSTLDELNSKSISDASTANGNDLSSLQNNHAVDDATQTSIQSAIDENNLNANSFNSATSSSPAASLSAIYTTSSITNNNNSILSRKNSLTTPNQHLINSSKAPKVDSMPDYLSASSLNNHPQAALLSAMLYNQPYQQLALTQNLYSDPAQLAKEMAQKNYANALKFAVAQQNPSVAGKNQLTALPYSGVTLSANNSAMLQPGTSANRLQSPMTQTARSPFLPTLQRPMQNPYQQFIRPQMPVNMQAAANPYAQYAAAAAQHQFLSQQNFGLYPGLTSSMASPQLTATSVASSSPSPYASSSYPFAFTQAQAQAMSAQGLNASMMQVPQMTSQQAPTGSSNVLNPYKKMKTS